MPPSHLSNLTAAFKRGIQTSSVGQEGSLRETVGFLVGQGKLFFGNQKLLHTIPFPAFSDLSLLLPPGAVFAAQSNFHLVNRRRNITIVGAISRTFSIPSVSGPSFQVCGYHIDRLLSENSLMTTMAACGSKSVPGDWSLYSWTSKLGSLAVSLNSITSFRNNVVASNCRKASMSLRNKEQPNNFFVYGFFIYNSMRRRDNSLPGLGFELNSGFHSSAPACSSTGTAHDVCFDTSNREQLTTPATSPEQNHLAGRTLKLISGSCYLPHPDKVETGGEDAHFICPVEQAIGVADGVGGWAEHGVDAGKFARELMSHSVDAIKEEPKGCIDTARVLEKAHASTKAKGSSTACIIALTEQFGMNTYLFVDGYPKRLSFKGLCAINLGDSGFIVVRDGCTIFRSPVQQHDFNFTYQLESGNSGDLPSSGQVFTIPVAPGDVIIAGTDGLFDNLYNNEVTAVVVHAMRAGLGPQVSAQKIAALARQRAQDKNRQTPFSTAAQDAGFRYYGGKLDDITVVVSYIASDNEKASISGSSS